MEENKEEIKQPQNEFVTFYPTRKNSDDIY